MPDWTDFIAPVAGALIGSQSGAKQAGTTTTTQTPWAPMQPYLTGIANQATQLYGQNTEMPDYLRNAYTNFFNNNYNATNGQGAQALQQAGLNILQGAGFPGGNLGFGSPNVPRQQATMQSGADALGAEYGSAPSDTTSTQGVYIPGQGTFSGAGVVAGGGSGSGGYTSSFAGNITPASGGNLGLPDATEAYRRMLTGQVDTAAYDPMFDAASRRFRENFDQNIQGINQGSAAAGQYGSSRQGIAQGLAARSMGNSMADMGASLYGNAYNTAQNNMFNAANSITQANLGARGQDISAATSRAATGAASANAAAALAEQQRQFDANYGLSRYRTGLDAYTTVGNMMNSTNVNNANLGLGTINQSQGANNYGWQQLGNLQGSIQPMAGLGSQQSNPYFTNPYAGAIAGANLGLGMWNAYNQGG